VVVLPEAPVSLAAEIVVGEILYARDSTYGAEYQLYASHGPGIESCGNPETHYLFFWTIGNMFPEYNKISGFYPPAKLQVLKEANRSLSFPAGRYTLKRKLMMSPSSTT
jgi:hypothetical protein